MVFHIIDNKFMNKLLEKLYNASDITDDSDDVIKSILEKEEKSKTKKGRDR